MPLLCYARIQTMSVNYPALNFEPEPEEPNHTPLAPPLENRPVLHECGICGKPVRDGLAHTVLECKHRIHLLCTRNLLKSAKNVPESIGGAQWCSLCRRDASASGRWDAAVDPELSDDRIISTLNAKHAKCFKRDVCFALENGAPTPELEKKLLGSEHLGKRVASALGSFTSSVKLSTVWSSDKPNGVDPESDSPCDPRTMTERMAQARRTLDRVFESTDADAADLFNAGVCDMAALRKLGFSAGLHLTEPYRRRLPIFALASHFGLSWADIKHLSPRTVCEFKLTAPEFRLLGCGVSDLIEAKWKGRDVMHMGIAPSKLVKYMGMQVVHLNVLGLTLNVFTANERWRRDFVDLQSDFRALLSDS